LVIASKSMNSGWRASSSTRTTVWEFIS